MGRHHLVLIEDLAARGGLAVKAGAVVRGQPDLERVAGA